MRANNWPADQFIHFSNANLIFRDINFEIDRIWGLQKARTFGAFFFWPTSFWSTKPRSSILRIKNLVVEVVVRRVQGLTNPLPGIDRTTRNCDSLYLLNVEIAKRLRKF
jgi:hypothetical protein